MNCEGHVIGEEEDSVDLLHDMSVIRNIEEYVSSGILSQRLQRRQEWSIPSHFGRALCSTHRDLLDN
jgi:hypothetical protein